MITTKADRAAKAAIQKMARSAMEGRNRLLSGAVRLEALFVYAIPVSWPKYKQQMALEGRVWKTSRPDGDNMIKLIMDALNGIVWTDDAQVVRWSGAKRYGGPERTVVRISELEDHFAD